MNTSEKQKNDKNCKSEYPVSPRFGKRIMSYFHQSGKPGLFVKVLKSIKGYFSILINGKAGKAGKAKNKKTIKKWKSFKPYRINEFFFSKN